MNRAWIPAGALAGVSVAGLIAMGQVTDSLSPSVPFPASVPVTSPSPSPSAVPVSLPAYVAGKTETQHASLNRGGQAAASQTPTSGEAGQVSLRVRKTASPVRARSTSPTPSTSTTVPKKKPKRPTSITGVSSGGGSANGDAGLTGGGSSSTPDNGGLHKTLGSDSP